MIRALDALEDSVIVLSPEGDYLFVNKTAAARLGMPKSKILGQNVWVLFPYLIGSPFEIAFGKTVEDGLVRTIEDYYESRGLWYRSTISSSEIGIIMQVEDVTEYKKTKATNDLLVATLEEALDPEPKITKPHVL